MDDLWVIILMVSVIADQMNNKSYKYQYCPTPVVATKENLIPTLIHLFHGKLTQTYNVRFNKVYEKLEERCICIIGKLENSIDLQLGGIFSRRIYRL